MPRLDHGQDSEKNSKKRTHLILQLLPNQIIQRKKGVIPSNHSPIVFGIFRTKNCFSWTTRKSQIKNMVKNETKRIPWLNHYKGA